MTRPRHWFACVAAVIVLGALNACVAAPVKTIAFQADSVPAHNGLIVHIDLTYTQGTVGSAQYPFDTAGPAPIFHFQEAQVGTVASYLLTAWPIEPGQIAHCLISINGLIVDQHKATFPKAAVCGGPPV